MSRFQNSFHAYLLLLALVLATTDYVTTQSREEEHVNVPELTDASIPRVIQGNLKKAFDSVYDKTITRVANVEVLSARISQLDQDISSQQNVTDRFFSGLKLIFPGTRWCGDGDIAKNENDLGRFNETDYCCRDHDHCFSNLEVGQEKHGLKNTGFFTRSHCSCDNAFYNCLKAVNSIVSNEIGITYFDVLSPQCFQEDYPIVRCKKHAGIINRKCVEYEFDTSKKKVYEWFDNRKWV